MEFEFVLGPLKTPKLRASLRRYQPSSPRLLDSPIWPYCWFASALTAGTQFIVTKQGEEAQTGPAEYLATAAIMSCRRDNTLLKHSAHSPVLQHWQLRLLTKHISLCWNIMAPNHLWDHWAKAPSSLPTPSCIFKICRGCTDCRVAQM